MSNHPYKRGYGSRINQPGGPIFHCSGSLKHTAQKQQKLLRSEKHKIHSYNVIGGHCFSPEAEQNEVCMRVNVHPFDTNTNVSSSLFK